MADKLPLLDPTEQHPVKFNIRKRKIAALANNFFIFSPLTVLFFETTANSIFSYTFLKTTLSHTFSMGTKHIGHVKITMQECKRRVQSCLQQKSKRGTPFVRNYISNKRTLSTRQRNTESAPFLFDMISQNIEIFNSGRLLFKELLPCTYWCFRKGLALVNKDCSTLFGRSKSNHHPPGCHTAGVCETNRVWQ